MARVNKETAAMNWEPRDYPEWMQREADEHRRWSLRRRVTVWLGVATAAVIWCLCVAFATFKLLQWMLG